MTHPDELAIYLPDGALAPPTNPYGRLVANAGVYRALARYGGYRSLHFQCRRPAEPLQLARELLLPAAGQAADEAGGGAPGAGGSREALPPVVGTGSPLSTAAAVRAGDRRAHV